MGTGLKITLFVVIVVVTALIVYATLWISASNREIGLRNLAAGQQDVCKMVFDETWKIISQKAQVADKYKEAYKEIFPALMEGRYGNERGGALMSWITEHNPEFDSSLYKEISNSIESQRHKFTEAQTRLRDIKVQHDDLRLKWPNSWFVGNRPELKITIVTSEKTESIFQTGQENDVKVF